MLWPLQPVVRTETERVRRAARFAGAFAGALPKGYDMVNHATHDHKERIKVGYNRSLHRHGRARASRLVIGAYSVVGRLEHGQHEPVVVRETHDQKKPPD